MTLASSGSINMVGPDSAPRRSIGVELGNGTLTTPVSLLSAGVLALVGKSSGPVTMPGDFYGRSTSFIFNDVVPAASQLWDYNLRNRALAAGWDGVNKLIATTTTAASNSQIFATNRDTPAMTDGDLDYPSGSTWSIVNNGYIHGFGGAGGAGGTASGSILTPGGAGSNGGTAIYLNGFIPVSLTNNNAIGSGGGGGGGGGAAYYDPGTKGGTTYGAGGGGGGGGSGFGIGGPAGAIGGAGGGASGNTTNYPGTSAGNGLGVAGGVAGVGGNSGGVNAVGGNTSGGDGYGGSWGSDGIPGSPGTGSGTVSAGGNGGTAGWAIYGVSFVTFVVAGFITGPQG